MPGLCPVFRNKDSHVGAVGDRHYGLRFSGEIFRLFGWSWFCWLVGWCSCYVFLLVAWLVCLIGLLLCGFGLLVWLFVCFFFVSVLFLVLCFRICQERSEVFRCVSRWFTCMLFKRQGNRKRLVLVVLGGRFRPWVLHVAGDYWSVWITMSCSRMRMICGWRCPPKIHFVFCQPVIFVRRDIPSSGFSFWHLLERYLARRPHSQVGWSLISFPHTFGIF